MTYLHSVRASGVNPILLDGGDWLFAMKDLKANRHQRRQMIEKGKLIVEAYNRFGYDAAAVAECEMVLGMDVLRELQKQMRFPLLCANLVDLETEKQVFQPSLVIERNGKKIGVVALLMDTLQPSFLDKIAPGTRLIPPLVALRTEVDRLKDQVDMIFVLGHCNRPTIEKMAKEFPEVDFVLEANSYMGSDSIWVSTNRYFVENHGKVLLKVDGQGAHLGRLDVHLEHPGQPWASRDTQVEEGKVVNRFLGTDIELAPHIGQNATMEQMVQTFKRRTRFVAIDEPDEFVPSDRYLTADTCGACHPDQYDAWAESGHARAYATLEKTGDEFRYDCIPCHVLGYGETFIDAHKPAANKNVQCESCHGTNPKHPTNPKRHSWKTVDERACWGCHNPEVTRAEFTPSTMVPMVACPPLARDPEQGK